MSYMSFKTLGVNKLCSVSVSDTYSRKINCSFIVSSETRKRSDINFHEALS